MPRPILLFTGPWADLPLDALAAKAGEVGLPGLELCCWGDHLEVQRGLSDDDYAPARLDLLARHDLQVPVDRQPQGRPGGLRPDRRPAPGAACPDYVWGDGDPAGVRQRAAEEMTATFRLAERLGAGGRERVHRVADLGLRRRLPGPEAGGDRRRPASSSPSSWNPILDAARDVRGAVRLRGPPRAARVRPVLGRGGARRARRPGGVRLHVRPEPPALAGRGPGRVLAAVPGPHLPRPRQGRAADAQRPGRGAGRVLAERRPAARLAVPLARATAGSTGRR